MSRVSKILLLVFVAVFALACNFVTQPINDAQQAVATVQSLATALPIETLKALPSAIPVSTLEAIPSEIPDFGNLANPQGEPLSEWNGIPIMPTATAGEESSGLYSFKANSTVAEVLDYYKTEMGKLGWTEAFSMPDTGGTALLSYEKDNNVVLITITENGDGSLVVLTAE